MGSVHFSKDFFQGPIKELHALLNAREDSQHRINFSISLGKGWVQVAEVEPGAQLRFWKYDCLEPLTVDVEEGDVFKDVVFSIYYFLTGKPENILLFTSEGPLRVNLIPGKVQFMVVCITEAWLRNLFPETIPLLKQASEAAFFSKVMGRVGTLSSNEYKILQELFENLENNQSEPYSSRTRLIVLLYQLFNLCEHKIKGEPEINHSAHENVMGEIAKRLSEAVSATFPGLEEIAKDFNMSVSTLKRQFKVQFNVTIYQYYLTKKMEQAVLLLEGEKKISEVAYLLGYENVSHFIKMFKKQYGVSPGSHKSNPDGGAQV